MGRGRRDISSVRKFSESYGHHMMLTAVVECPTQKHRMLSLPTTVILKLYRYYLSKRFHYYCNCINILKNLLKNQYNAVCKHEHTKLSFGRTLKSHLV